jgi:hypothetical protein
VKKEVQRDARAAGMQEDMFTELLRQHPITNCFARKITNPEKRRGFMEKTDSVALKDDRKMKRRTATPRFSVKVCPAAVCR